MTSSIHHIRPFEPVFTEYEAIVRVYNQANPNESGSAQTWQHWDQHRDPARLFSRYVVERGGEIGGYGYSMRTDPVTNKFRFAVYFLPEWQTPALIHKFFSFIMERCLDHSPAALLCLTREDELDKMAWLKKQAFREVMRYPCSILNVASFDPGDHEELNRQLTAQGIEIFSLVDLAERDLDWQKKVYDLEMLLARDVPRPSSFVPPPFAQYKQSTFDDPNFLPQLWFIARHGDAYIGTTSLFKPGDGIELLENYLTGTRRDFRRRGLATALKCRAIEEAQRLGAQRIITYNEENNPMYELNLKLGFQPQPADIDWQKTVP